MDTGKRDIRPPPNEEKSPIRGKEAILAPGAAWNAQQGNPSKGEDGMNKSFFQKTIAPVLHFICAYMRAMSALQRA